MSVTHLAPASPSIKPAPDRDGLVAAAHTGPALVDRYRAARARSRALAAPLSAEDAMLQSMPDASPAKWHLAHTSWFFEQFALGADPDYRPVDADWTYLFNSYYHSVGPMHARPQRGLLSRPSLQRVLEHREQVDARMQALLQSMPPAQIAQIVALGLQHEQQHQELLLTDIKHALWCNPLRPAYRDDLAQPVPAPAAPLHWVVGVDDGSSHGDCIVEIGAPPWPQHEAFAFDNESPRHRVLLHPHALASRPVSNSEYRQFIADGGYRTPDLWLSEGWATAQAQGWQAPLYWDEDLEQAFTLSGMRAIDPQAPVCHVSYYEADAFARWAAARLPTEAEWEHAAAQLAVRGNFADSDILHPAGAAPAADREGDFSSSQADLQPRGGVLDKVASECPRGTKQMFGDVWEWTASAYLPYPGFKSMSGALGEYNGKFMCGQQVLRGGSCASPGGHLRASYRNFFQPPDRWQFSGLRLARDLP